MHILPHGLMTFLLACPVFANPFDLFVTQNRALDPFYNVRTKVPAALIDPVCCLKAPEGEEPTAEILSFEEWKEKQRAREVPDTTSESSPESETKSSPEQTSSHSSLQSHESSPQPLISASSIPHVESPKMQLPIPTTDRFNFASEDCSARIHKTHPGAQSAFSLLSRKKDKYMLSPCAAKDKFVIMELCDDIRIDTIQLANFEFFSGVFRDIRISVAQQYLSDTDGWTEVGTYQAKNSRGVQVCWAYFSMRTTN